MKIEVQAETDEAVKMTYPRVRVSSTRAFIRTFGKYSLHGEAAIDLQEYFALV
jgi:phage baseplate assembly protein W